MPNKIQHKLTYAVTMLTMEFQGTPLSSGSGFFWRQGDAFFLVTNWHNVSGRDPATGQPLSTTTAAVPDALTFTAFQLTSPPDESGYRSLAATTRHLPLLDGTGNPCWIEHSTHRNAVDVVAIPVPDAYRNELYIRGANEELEDLGVDPRASQDAFVVGFPLGMIAGFPIPVWKRATIATEPGVDLDGLPKLLVDTATRSGMSGSLVLAHHILLGPYKLASGEEKKDNLISVRDSILGVYSGRLGNDQVQAQLGIVWKRTVIDELLATGLSA